MERFEKQLLVTGVGIIALTALLRITAGSLASALSGALAEGVAAERTTLDWVLTVMDLLVAAGGSAGPAVLAAALVLIGVRRQRLRDET